MTDSEITIVVNGDSSKADKVLDHVSGKIDDLKGKVEGLSINVNMQGLQTGTEERLAVLSESLAKIAGAMPKLASFSEAMSNLADGLGQLKNGIPEGAGEAIGGMVKDVAAGAGDLTSVDVSKINDLATAIGEVGRAGSSGLAGSIGSGSLENMKKTLDGIASAASEASKAGDGIAAMGRGLNAIPDGLAKFGKDRDWSGNIASFGRAVSGVSAEMEGMGAAAKAVSSLGNGVSNLAKGLIKLSDDEMSGGVDRLMSSLNQLGGFGDSAISSMKAVSSLTSAIARFAKLGAEQSGLSEMFTRTSDALRKFNDSLKGAFTEDDLSHMRDVSSALRGIGSAASSINRLAKSIENMAKADVGASIANIRSIMESMATLGDASANAANAISPFVSMVSRMVSTVSKFSSIGDSIKQFAANLAEITTAVRDFANAMSSAVDDDQLSRFERLAAALDGISKGRSAAKAIPVLEQKVEAAEAAEAAPPGVIEGLQGLAAKDFMGGLPSQIAEFAPHLGVVVALMERLAPAARAYASAMGKVMKMPFEAMAQKIRDIGDRISKIASRIARFVAYRAMRYALRAIVEGISSGLQNLYQWALVVGNSFVDTMDSMATSAQYLRNSVAASFSGLLDIVAPILDAIIDRVVAAFNAINQLFSALSGAGIWRKAVKVQASFAEAADSAGSSASGAKKAIDEYKNTVLDFDELHKLNDVDDYNRGGGGGGGAGDSGIDYGGMFEEVPVDQFWLDLANSADWSALGAAIAEGLNSWEASIDWDGIEDTAMLWSERVWTTFNGFVENRDWQSLGTTVANGINVGLHFIDDIAQNADWTAFGTGLAESLNSTVSNLDWSAFGRVLTDGLKIAFETLHGFMGEFDWDSLREGIIEGIDSAFENIDWATAIPDAFAFITELGGTAIVAVGELIANIDKAIQETDWSAIGSDIATRLSNALSNIDWDAVGRFLTDGINVAFGLLSGFVQDFDWYNFGKDMAHLISEAISNIDWSNFGSLLSGAITGLVELIVGFAEETVLDLDWWGGVAEGIVDGIVGAIEGFDLAGSLEELGQILLVGIIDAVQFVISVLDSDPTIHRMFGWLLDDADSALEQLKIDMGYGGSESIGKLGQGMESNKNAFNSKLKAIEDGLSKSLAKNEAASLVSGKNVSGNLASGMDNRSGSVTTSAKSLNTIVSNNIGNISSTTWGKNVAQRFANGISGKEGAVKTSSSGIRTAVYDRLSNKGFSGDYFNAHTWGYNVGKRFATGLGTRDKVAGSSSSSIRKAVYEKLSTKGFSGDTFNANTWGVNVGKRFATGLGAKEKTTATSASSIRKAAYGKLSYQGFKDGGYNAYTWGTEVGRRFAKGIDDKKGSAGTSASNVRGKVSAYMADENVWSNNWALNIGQKYADGLDSKKDTVGAKASNVYDRVSWRLNSSNVPSYTWGWDISDNLANGIGNREWRVLDSVTSVAAGIKRILGFSEPEEGPLSDFHTYMPDMMRLMAQGIEGNAHLVTDEIENLADAMRDALPSELSSDISIGGSYDIDGIKDAAMRATAQVDDRDIRATMQATIANAVALGTVGMYGSRERSAQPVELVIRVDGRELARAAYNGMDDLMASGVINAAFV